MEPEISPWNVNAINVPLAIQFGKRLDDLETKIVFKAGEILFPVEVKFGNALVDWVIARPNKTSSDDLWLVVLKVYSFQYRIRAIHPLASSKQEMIAQLIQALKSWKEGIEQFINKQATTNDLTKIGALSRYDKFTDRLLHHEEMKETCFSLIFKENFPVDILVQYINTSTLILKEAILTMRVGFHKKYGTEKLTITEKDNKKDLELLINNKFVSILNPDEQIQLNGGRQHTWRELQVMGKDAKKVPAKLEMFHDVGLILFRSQGLEYPVSPTETARIDTTKPNFWDHAEFRPLMMYSKEALEELLQIKIPEDKPCVITVEASCLDPLYVDHAHGNSTIFLRRESGQYQMIPCGKYAARFPLTNEENALFLGNSVEAEFTCPDPNIFYAYRFKGCWRLCVTQKEAEERLMIYGRILKYFQFANNNCSADFQCSMEDTYGKIEDGGLIPNFFRLPALESKAVFPINLLYDPMAHLPTSIASFLLHGIHVIFGSKREYKVDDSKTISVYDSEYAKNGILYVPGMLPYRILTGEIEGIVSFGYD